MFFSNQTKSILILSFILILSSASVLSAKSIRIIKIMGKHAAIDQGEGGGLILGDTYQILRKSMGIEKIIGEARIKAIRKKFSAVEIIRLKSGYQIMAGDELAPLYSEDTIIYNTPLGANKQLMGSGLDRSVSFPSKGFKEYGGSATIQMIDETHVLSFDALAGYFIQSNIKVGVRAVLNKTEGAPTFGVGAAEYSYYFNASSPTPVKPYIGAVLGVADNGMDIKPALGCHVGLNITHGKSKWANRMEIFIMSADISMIGLRIGFSVFE